jgi:hypothetical protein
MTIGANLAPRPPSSIEAIPCGWSPASPEHVIACAADELAVVHARGAAPPFQEPAGTGARALARRAWRRSARVRRGAHRLGRPDRRAADGVPCGPRRSARRWQARAWDRGRGANRVEEGRPQILHVARLSRTCARGWNARPAYSS